MWFDGVEPIGRDQWDGTPARVAAFLHRAQPDVMLGNHSGTEEDFVSFEAMVGPFNRLQPWEMAEQINPSGWVFNQPMPTRPFRELLRNLVYTISRDGNYLLDVGPMQDGRIYPPDAERLREFAAWMRVNGEGVHGTRGGPYRDVHLRPRRHEVHSVSAGGEGPFRAPSGRGTADFPCRAGRIRVHDARSQR